MQPIVAGPDSRPVIMRDSSFLPNLPISSTLFRSSFNHLTFRNAPRCRRGRRNGRMGGSDVHKTANGLGDHRGALLLADNRDVADGTGHAAGGQRRDARGLERQARMPSTRD